MKELFWQVIHLSLVGAYSAVAVFLARVSLKRAPRWISYRLWLVVFFRLLCPVSISSVISLFRPIGKSVPLYTRFGKGFSVFSASFPFAVSKQAGVNGTAVAVIGGQTGREAVNPAQQIGEAVKIPAVQISREFLFDTIFPIIWSIGVAVMLLYGIWSVWKVYGRIKTATRIEDNCFETDQIQTSFVFGIFRPRIFLPVNTRREDRKYILCHEQIHIQRYDPLVKWIGWLVLAIHWFNPVVWGVFFLFEKDMELSCDEQVLREMGTEAKAEYGALLLRSAVQQSVWIQSLSFGKGYGKERIRVVMRYKKANWWISGASMLLAAFVLAACAVNPPENIQPSVTATATETTSSTLGNQLYTRRVEHAAQSPQQIEALIEILPIPNSSKLRGISIQKADGTNTVVLSYDSLDDKREMTQEEVFPIAALLFAVTDDVDQVTFTCFWNQPELSSLRFDETVSREKVNQFLGCDVRTYGESPEDMETLIKHLEQENPLLRYEGKDPETAVAVTVLRESGRYYGGECAAEGHVILEIEENEDITTVYALISESKYGFQNGIFTPMGGSGAIPAVFTLVKNDAGEYACAKYELPRDGAEYMTSLEELFPKSLWGKVKGADQYYESLMQQKEAYAKAYLEQIGREAEIQDQVEVTLPELPVDVSNALLERFWDYPYFIGTEERIEDGIRHIYETRQEQGGSGAGIMVYEKRTEDGTVVQRTEIDGKDGSILSISDTPLKKDEA